MAILSIFSGSYCHGEDVVEQVAEKLQYKILDKELLDATADRFKVSASDLVASLTGTSQFLKKFSHEREKNIAMLRLMLAELIQMDNLIVPGFYGHLIPRTIAHLLKVCLIANFDYRVGQTIKAEGLSEKQAQKAIHKDDQDKSKWTQFTNNSAPYSDRLYDITIPMNRTTIDGAVGLIFQHAQSDAVKATERSKKAADDFILAAKVRHTLAQAGHDEETYAEDGRVTIIINKYIVRLEKYERELKKIAEKVEGIKEINARTGRDYSPPSIMPLGELEMPSKILLVDDEKEFVQTLSERLLTRNLESSVVYDGEQALEHIKQDEPDVMVLDIRMPGIDGIEVLKRVKTEHPNVEVIILTGHGSEKEETIANELGAFAYLQKPINVDRLAQVMKAAYKKINDSAKS
ncbi:response regulator [candidate division LCP-89 bacterium B3_LCP]|uniref:Response regulator n=1 Tax=candidate division LCP-89 bacterium B3_LCP TaxID=2012998 RepID=A0A532UXS8_UNCL8|nr:MAG: response regulator [candidate division LCP-89 bacterium B3_LCP]